MNLVSRIAVFSVGFFAFVFLVVLLIPQAVITIEPETMDIVKTYSIDLEMDQSGIITKTPRLPTRQVQSIIEGRLRLPTTGRAAQPDQSARGEVTFTNLTDHSLAIPVGTTVRTLDLAAPHFVTQSRVNLDPQEGAQITVEVVASSPGPEGNVKAEAIQAIDGLLGLSATVSNLDPFTGGSLEIRSAVSTADLVLVRLELENNLFNADEETSIDVTISAQVFISADPSLIRKIVRGKKASEALEDLKGEIPNEEILSVDISPAWLHRFPFLDLQIHIHHPWEADT
jgi:hypothetical protein